MENQTIVTTKNIASVLTEIGKDKESVINYDFSTFKDICIDGEQVMQAVITLPIILEHLKPSQIAEFDGFCWASILEKHPHLISRAVTTKMNGKEWAHVLATNPELHTFADFDIFTGGDIERLISSQADLIHLVDLSKLSGSQWEYVLSEKPHLMPLANYDIFTKKDWENLKSAHPSWTYFLIGGSWKAIEMTC